MGDHAVGAVRAVQNLVKNPNLYKDADRTHDRMTTDAYRTLPGTAPAEKLGGLGFAPGRKVDIREIGRASCRERVYMPV
jgi:hypothetical protein